MTASAAVEQAHPYYGDAGPMFRIAIPSLRIVRPHKSRRVPANLDIRAEFCDHFERDLKPNGRMDSNLTGSERDQVDQMQRIRDALKSV